MGAHPANLGLRFILELTALGALGWWGYSLTDGWVRFVTAAVIPLGAAVVWGTFAVPDDPSRSGRAPVAVRGWIRLIIELIVFGAGVVGLAAVDQTPAALVFFAVLVIHYLLSIDRIAWLLKR